MTVYHHYLCYELRDVSLFSGDGYAKALQQNLIDDQAPRNFMPACLAGEPIMYSCQSKRGRRRCYRPDAALQEQASQFDNRAPAERCCV